MGSIVLVNRRSKKEKKAKDRQPGVWVSLKRSLHCKPEPGEVLDPEATGPVGSILNRRLSRSGCSRSIANLKDVVHGSRRHLERPQSCSPRSIGSSEFLNPITHEVVLSNSKCELRITGFNGCYEGETGGMSSTFVGTLRPGTPGPLGHLRGVESLTPPRRSPTVMVGKRESNGYGGSSLTGSVSGNNGSDIRVHGGYTPRASVEYTAPSVACLKCGEKLLKFEDLESHHLSKHAVTELVEGDSSRKIVEIICRTSLLKESDPNCGRIDRILKVHNMQKTLVFFEEHREMIKNKASKLPKKHPRCLADGNELLRFHGTTIACNIGINGSSNLCVSESCRVCQIIRHGFSAKELKGGIGVFTTSTSARAVESIELNDNDCSTKKALLVCRVIAGRVHKPLENFQEISAHSGFDSLAGKVGLYSNTEELYLLNPRALLPCFVVVFKA